MTHDAIRMPATIAIIAQNSVVLNACFVSDESRSSVPDRRWSGKEPRRCWPIDVEDIGASLVCRDEGCALIRWSQTTSLMPWQERFALRLVGNIGTTRQRRSTFRWQCSNEGRDGG